MMPGATGSRQGPLGEANRSDVADHPIGRRNGQAEQDQKNPALNVLLFFDVAHFHFVFRRLMNFANPCARSLQAGHSPQP